MPPTVAPLLSSRATRGQVRQEASTMAMIDDHLPVPALASAPITNAPRDLARGWLTLRAAAACYHQSGFYESPRDCASAYAEAMCLARAVASRATGAPSFGAKETASPERRALWLSAQALSEMAERAYEAAQLAQKEKTRASSSALRHVLVEFFYVHLPDGSWTVAMAAESPLPTIPPDILKKMLGDLMDGRPPCVSETFDFVDGDSYPSAPAPAAGGRRTASPAGAARRSSSRPSL